jgi:hypothetical protein
MNRMDKLGVDCEGRSTLTLRTDVHKFEPSDAKHFYPNHTLRTPSGRGFDSISLRLNKGYQPGTVSEVANMKLTEMVLNLAAVNTQMKRVEDLTPLGDKHIDEISATKEKATSLLENPVPPKWHCICIGGNTQSGINAVIQEGYRFESVARSFLATQK